MNSYIILNNKKNNKKILELVNAFKLTNTLKNKRTSIWENDDLQISIDKSIIRIYADNNIMDLIINSGEKNE